MIRILFVGLVTSYCVAVHAEGAESLGLSAADLERLGVVLEPPQSVAEIEIASGPAEVVIPPAQQIVVSSTISGVVSRFFVAEGDLVESGQPLAEITSAELLALQHDYIEATVAAELAIAQRQRDLGLHTDGIISERRLQESAAAERAATTALDQIRQQLVLGGMTSADLDRLRDTGELSPTLTLRARFAGVVIEQMSDLGSPVDALEPVYRLADLSRLWLEVHVPQERAMAIEPGMLVVAESGNRVLEAQVTNVGRVVDAASQTVLVRAGVDNSDLALRVGQFIPARVLERIDQGTAALAVPNAAVVRADGDVFVFVAANGEVSAWPVEIIAEGSINTYIRGGVDADSQIAVAGVAALKSVWVSAADGSE